MQKKSDWKNVGKADLSLHLPSGVYYVRKKFVRRKIPPLFKTTGETKQHLAKERAIALIQQHLDLHLKREKTFGEVAEEFLRVETSNPGKRRRGTQQNHRMYFGELGKELGGYLISQVADEVFWSDWLSSFRQKKKRRTFNDYAIYANMLMRYAHRRKYISHLVKFPFVDEKRNVGRVLTKQEIANLYATMRSTTKDQFVLAYECAMRLRETLHLTWDRVDFESGKIRLGKDDVKTGSKTGKGREFLMSPNALERLRARKERAGDSPYVFPSRSDPRKPQGQNKTAWEKAKRRAGISGRCRWHDIRHTAITHMVADPRQSIGLVSEYVGASVRTLQRVYLHSTAEQTRPVAFALRVNG